MLAITLSLTLAAGSILNNTFSYFQTLLNRL